MLWYIIEGVQDGDWRPGATFNELRKLTELSATTLSAHLKALLAEGLIQRVDDREHDRLAYVIVDEKQRLIELLKDFIERQRKLLKDYTQVQRLVQDLEKALKPLGKVPREIQKVMQEMEQEYEQAWKSIHH